MVRTGGTTVERIALLSSLLAAVFGGTSRSSFAASKAADGAMRTRFSDEA
jgi:hypothetical protein